MGIKLSTQISKKKKRITNSLQSPKKTYNTNSNDHPSINSSSTNPNYNEKQAVSSISSITDSMFMSGRTFHHVANSAYWFPNDDEEMDRLIGVKYHLCNSQIETNQLNNRFCFITIATFCIKDFIWRVLFPDFQFIANN
jgi:hypothetical protein